MPQLDLKARYSVADGGRTIDFPAGNLLNPVYATLNQLTGTQQFPQIRTSINLREKSRIRLTLVAPLLAPQLDSRYRRARESLYQAETASREALARHPGARRQASFVHPEAGACCIQPGIQRAHPRENVCAWPRLPWQDGVRHPRLPPPARRGRALGSSRSTPRVPTPSKPRRYLNFLRGRSCWRTPVELPAAEGPGRRCRAGSWSRRLERRQIEHAVDAADAKRRAARAGRWPTLALPVIMAEGERYELDREHDFSMASLVLNWSVFDFGLRRAQQAQATAETASLGAQRDDLRQKLVLAEQAAREDLAVVVPLRAIDKGATRCREVADESFRISSRKRDEASCHRSNSSMPSAR